MYHSEYRPVSASSRQQLRANSSAPSSRASPLTPSTQFSQFATIFGPSAASISNRGGSSAAIGYDNQMRGRAQERAPLPATSSSLYRSNTPSSFTGAAHYGTNPMSRLIPQQSPSARWQPSSSDYSPQGSASPSKPRSSPDRGVFEYERRSDRVYTPPLAPYATSPPPPVSSSHSSSLTTYDSDRYSQRFNQAPTKADRLSSSSTLAAAPDPTPRRTWYVQQQPVGLQNVGNTCYMNATLQCLMHQDVLVKGILEAKRLQPRDHPSPVVDTFIALAEESSISHRKPLLNKLKTLMGRLNSEFASYDQADGHELLRTLLIAMHEELNRRKGRVAYEELKEVPFERPHETERRWLTYHRQRDDSVIYDCFGGIIKAETRCNSCKYPSLSFDPFLDISLPFPRSALRTDSVILSTLFQDLFNEELIDAAQLWKCAHCKKATSAVRSQHIIQYPKLLVWHLKRFNSRGVKVEASVLFTDKIRLGEDITYSLCGVVCHSGTSFMGHYTSYVKSRHRWYYCNDTSVNETDVYQVMSEKSQAFMLFYERMER